jgi:endo-1,4-beta-xylanase
MPLVRLILLAALSALPHPTLAQGAPLASAQQKFLGSAYSPNQSRDFASYWNKVTPENAGKWGSVERVRDVMDWSGLDEAYGFAKQQGFPFHMHVLVWGNQQPEWIESLPPAEQRIEIEQWFAAVAARYPDLDFVEVVNEPLHDPPDKDDDGGGNYLEALGGSGASGWDWILEAFRLARLHFPRSRLLINDYSITNTPEDAARYRAIVELLQNERLVDGIGIQAHAFSTTTERPMSVHRANLDLLAGTGLPLYVTEFDIDGPSDRRQLEDYQRVFPVFWEHPAVKGVTLWGFRPGLWRQPQGANLIRRDGRERPALAWLRGYVRGIAGRSGTTSIVPAR